MENIKYKLHTDHALKVESTQNHQEKNVPIWSPRVLGLWCFPLILQHLNFCVTNTFHVIQSENISPNTSFLCWQRQLLLFPLSANKLLWKSKSDSSSLSEDEWVYPGTLRKFIHAMILEELCSTRNVASVGACEYYLPEVYCKCTCC